jgi:hypothetical protein
MSILDSAGAWKGGGIDAVLSEIMKGREGSAS